MNHWSTKSSSWKQIQTLLTFASQMAGSPQYQLLIRSRSLIKQLPFRNLILIMMKLRMMSSQPLPPIVFLFKPVRDMNLFDQTQLIILSLLLPHPQTNLLDLILLTLYFLSLLSYADLLKIPAPVIGLETMYMILNNSEINI